MADDAQNKSWEETFNLLFRKYDALCTDYTALSQKYDDLRVEYENAIKESQRDRQRYEADIKTANHELEVYKDAFHTTSKAEQEARSHWRMQERIYDDLRDMEDFRKLEERLRKDR